MQQIDSCLIWMKGGCLEGWGLHPLTRLHHRDVGRTGGYTTVPRPQRSRLLGGERQVLVAKYCYRVSFRRTVFYLRQECSSFKLSCAPQPSLMCATSEFSNTHTHARTLGHMQTHQQDNCDLSAYLLVLCLITDYADTANMRTDTAHLHLLKSSTFHPLKWLSKTPGHFKGSLPQRALPQAVLTALIKIYRQLILKYWYSWMTPTKDVIPINSKQAGHGHPELKHGFFLYFNRNQYELVAVGSN